MLVVNVLVEFENMDRASATAIALLLPAAISVRGTTFIDDDLLLDLDVPLNYDDFEFESNDDMPIAYHNVDLWTFLRRCEAAGYRCLGFSTLASHDLSTFCRWRSPRSKEEDGIDRFGKNETFEIGFCFSYKGKRYE